MNQILMRVVLLVLCYLSFSFAITNSELLSMLVKFYGYQRAGLKNGKCYNLNDPNWSHHGGDNYNGNPLDGGWYDAGDYIKFGMNLSYSVYCLLKAYDVFGPAFEDAYKWDHSNGSDGIPDILNQVKFATDYMCKAVINENTIVLDVGIAQEEHQVWGVTNSTGRDASKVILCSGGDIPATYAACLALMSVLYRKYDAAYADQCLQKAKIAFKFAKSKFNSGKEDQIYCNPQTKGGEPLYYYPKVDNVVTRQYYDRMAAAGVELYRATNGEDPTYAVWAKTSIPEFYNCMGYAYIGPLAAFEVWRQGMGSASALSANLNFIDRKVKTDGFFKGVYQNSGWGTARDVATAAFEYALAYVINPNEEIRKSYLQRVKDHIAWLTGSNSKNQSFICGVNGGPKKIHYRTTNYGTIPGAVVSGPDDQGNYDPNSTDAKYNEVAIDYNAGAVGAVAFLKLIENPGNAVKVTSAFKAEPLDNVDLNKTPVKFTATFSQSVNWTIDIIGSVGSKTITGSGTSINVSWDGSADKGCFLAGEIVRATLKLDKDIVAYDIVKATAQSIYIIGTKKGQPTSSDVLVDNFEDKDSINKCGGSWIAFGTGTGLRQTTFSITEQEGSTVLELKGNVVTSGPTTFAGVKTTFSADGRAVSIGNIKSIMFDLKSSVPTNIRVELEQEDITDSAYYGVTVPTSSFFNNYRVSISSFTQPEWATKSVPLDLNKIKSLRFTSYDSTGMFRFYIDNVYIEGLKCNTSNKYIPVVTYKKEGFSLEKSRISYHIPKNCDGNLELSIFDVMGKQVLKRVINKEGVEKSSISLRSLPTGIYFAEVKMIGLSKEGIKFTIVK